MRITKNAEFKDMTGMTFSHLTVLYRVENDKYGNAMWKCLCDCDNRTEVDVAGARLRSGKTKSCGCHNKRRIHETRFMDLTGREFTYLIVESLYGMEDGQGTAVWHCVCKCGEEVNVRGSSLTSGNTRSCGCIARDNLIGLRFGRLLVLKLDHISNECYWECICDCGNKKIITGADLRGRKYPSCGCWGAEIQRESHTKHGMSYTVEYSRVQGRKRRELERILDSTWTTQMEVELYKFFGKCVICGRVDRLSVDHVYPLVLGYGLKPGNAVILCVNHNSSKQDRMPEDLPNGTGDMLIRMAGEFKKYWDGLHLHTL